MSREKLEKTYHFWHEAVFYAQKEDWLLNKWDYPENRIYDSISVKLSLLLKAKN